MNWLRARREQIGIKTQEELTRLLQLEGIEITRPSISHWENGRYDIPLKDPEFRTALSRVLKLREPELMALAGYKTIGEHSEAGERAAHIVDALPEDRQRLAIRILEILQA